MSARATKPAIISVIREQRYVGAILPRGPMGFESFDSCDRSIGTFADAKLAHEAVLRSRAA